MARKRKVLVVISCLAAAVVLQAVHFKLTIDRTWVADLSELAQPERETYETLKAAELARDLPEDERQALNKLEDEARHLKLDIDYSSRPAFSDAQAVILGFALPTVLVVIAILVGRRRSKT